MIGVIIKEFRLAKLLGKGGMGEVWMAEQQLIHTRVAIKLLRPEVSQDQRHVERFFNEAVAVAKIKHAGIVKIFDVGFHQGRAFLIMEFLEGEPLAARIRRSGRLAIGDVAEIGRQIASILEATHAQRIVHRDLKPDNVFLTPDAELRERVKVLDFGIAKLGLGLTGTKDQMGTPPYMPPEQWDGAAKAGPPTDVYALGCLVFEMCCGRPPFTPTSIPEAYKQHTFDRPPRASSLALEVPRELDDLLARMLAKKPEERPAIHEVGAVLARLAAEHPRAFDQTASPDGTPPRWLEGNLDSTVRMGAGAQAADRRGDGRPQRGRRRLVSAVVGVAALASLAIFIKTSWSGDDKPDPPAPAPAPAPVVVVPDADASAPTDAPPAPVSCPAGMVRVPAGTFQMGSPDGVGHSEEHPQHAVTLSGYCIDKTEVTVAAYAECVAAKECTAAPLTVYGPGITKANVRQLSRDCNREDRGNHPINCVDWNQADAYCQWAGKRLPTEAEWEYAARHDPKTGEDREYPWGNGDPNEKLLNACGSECLSKGAPMYTTSDGWKTTAPVGSFPAGASPTDALDMAGNVWEWTADWYGAYTAAALKNPPGPSQGDVRVLRGGAWDVVATTWVRAAVRLTDAPASRRYYLGFRCARD